MENKMENRKQETDHPSVGQETTKQSVVITPELKVIVATDNGVIENGTEHVGLDGLFVIDATSVARLLAALDGKVIQDVWFGDKRYITGASQIINDLNSEVKRLEAKREEEENRHVEELCRLRREHFDELTKQKNEYKKDNEAQGKEIGDLYRESVALSTEVNLLRMRVEKFNNTRRIWERKLDIDDISKTEIKDPTRRIGSFLYGPY
jgi:phage host-nuclease inhibitor protein Gam